MAVSKSNSSEPEQVNWHVNCKVILVRKKQASSSDEALKTFETESDVTNGTSLHEPSVAVTRIEMDDLETISQEDFHSLQMWNPLHVYQPEIRGETLSELTNLEAEIKSTSTHSSLGRSSAQKIIAKYRSQRRKFGTKPHPAMHFIPSKKLFVQLRKSVNENYRTL